MASPDDPSSSGSQAPVDNSKQTSLSSASIQKKPGKICRMCTKTIEGQFVRTSHGHFHTECFKCHECGVSVIQKFFPLTKDEELLLFCEHHYFKRLGLLCHGCKKALRGPFISAAGHKYHVEHFKCSAPDCSRVFQQDDCYYERDGNVFCGPHYAIQHANRCAGCGCAILKTFVKAGHEEKDMGPNEWHPPCYLLSRQWNINLLQISGFAAANEQNPDNFDDISRYISVIIHRLLTAISTFEETSAESVTEMLVTIAGVDLDNAVTQASQFNRHIAYFFDGVEELDRKLISAGAEPCLNGRDPKRLVRQIVDFYNVLMGVRDPAGRAAYTRQLITLVSNLAQTLKSVIRGTLLGALKLEFAHSTPKTIEYLAERLESFVAKDSDVDVSIVQKCLDEPLKSHLCSYCNNPLEEGCFTLEEQNLRYHAECLKCVICSIALGEQLPEASLGEGGLRCKQHRLAPGDPLSFVQITSYQQYKHLMNYALQRLCKALDLSAQSFEDDGGEEDLGVLSEEEQVRQQMNSVVETTQRDSSLDPQQPPGASVPMHQQTSTSQHTSVRVPMIGVNGEPIIPSGAGEGHQQPAEEQPAVSAPQPVVPWGKEPDGYYRGVHIAGLPQPDISFGEDQVILTELSGLQMLSLRQLFALAIHRESEEAFPLSMLLDIGNCGISDKNKNVFSKMLSKFRKKKKPLEGLFGIQLEEAVENYGTFSMLGLGREAVRIPIFIEHICHKLMKMGFIWQGVFRESGSAGRVNKLKAMVNQDPMGSSFLNLERADHWDLTVLFKKFFIELPEPLLTFKLYPLFIWADSLPDLQQRLSALRMVVSMLPKPNLDLFSVVVRLMNMVAFYASPNDAYGYTGNKMTLENLAVVMGGCLLYTREIDASATKAAKDAARALQTIFTHYREVFSVPESSLSALHDPTDVSTHTDLIRKYEQVATDLRRMELGEAGEQEGNEGHLEG